MWESFLIKLAIPLVSLIGSYLAHAAAQYFKEKTKSERFKKAIDIADNIISTTVKSAEQVSVKQIKEHSANGRLSGEDKKVVFNNVLDRVKNQIPEIAKKELESEIPNLNLYFMDKIEASVRDMKK